MLQERGVWLGGSPSRYYPRTQKRPHPSSNGLEFLITSVQASHRPTTPLLALALAATAWALLQGVGPPLGDLGGPTWGPALAGLGAFGPPLLAGWILARRAGLSTGLARPPAWGLGAGLAAGPFLPLLAWLAVRPFPGAVEPAPGAPLAASLAASALAPALLEELLFRGLLLQNLRPFLPAWGAVGIAALASAAVHAAPAGQAAALATGLVLGALAIRARSAWPAVLAHAVSNGALIVLARATGTGAG